jgi:hypothetical protein
VVTVLTVLEEKALFPMLTNFAGGVIGSRSART